MNDLTFYIGGSLEVYYNDDGSVNSYYVSDPLLEKSSDANCLGKAKATFDTSKLQPGTYNIYVTYDGISHLKVDAGHPYMYKPSYAEATLTVLPNTKPVLDLTVLEQ